MYKIDDALNKLRAAVTALKDAKQAAEEAELPPDEVIALGKTIDDLEATIDRTYKLAMNRGSEGPIDLVKRFEIDPSRTRERRTED